MVDETLHRRAPFFQVADLSGEQCHATTGMGDVRKQICKQLSQRLVIHCSKN
jgi:hypothetical protein